MKRAALFTIALGVMTVAGWFVNKYLIAQSGGEADRDSTTTPHIDEELARASALCLAEVTRLQEIDERPSDGNLYVKASLKIIRRSGTIPDHLNITKEFGGLRPAGDVPVVRGPLRHDTLKKGQRYWFLFASQHDYEKYPQGVIRFWPDRAKALPPTVTGAIKADRYSWRPQFHPKSGVSYGYRVDLKKRQWQIRVESRGTLRWEKVIAGKKAEGYSSWWIYHRRDDSTNLQWADATESEYFLYAETVVDLPAGNNYNVPPGEYHLLHVFDVDTGKEAAIRVTSYQPGNVERSFRAYVFKTGKPRFERRQDFLENGGRNVGAKEERWLRRIERTFDPETGKETSEEIFRYGSTEKDGVTTSGWIKIEN